MKPGAYWIAAAAVAFVLAPPPLMAQSALPIHFLAGGGVAFPRGAGEDELSTGYQLQAAVEAAPLRSRLSVRVEGLLDRFPSRTMVIPPCGPVGTCLPAAAPYHEQRLGGIVDLVLNPLPGSPTASAAVVPYLIAGAGVFWHRLGRWEGDSATDFGANAGAGVRVPRVHAFLEVRGHLVRDAADVIPVMLGVRF